MNCVAMLALHTQHFNLWLTRIHLAQVLLVAQPLTNSDVCLSCIITSVFNSTCSEDASLNFKDLNWGLVFEEDTSKLYLLQLR